MCALLNIGAFTTALVDLQDLSTESGFQSAIQLLEQSAGIFSAWRYPRWSFLPSVPDLDEKVFQAMTAIALAQAQELFVLKAIEDVSKSSYVVKLAYSCKQLFSQAKHFVQFSKLGQDLDFHKQVNNIGFNSIYHY